MGRLMDRVMSSVNSKSPHALAQAKAELQTIAHLCRWTEGHWEELDGIAWNEIQNVHRHIRVLSNFLIRSYLHRRGAAA